VSLLLHGRAIARAAAGELPAADEAKLREHLRKCARCRARYDELSRTARAVGDGAAAAARERERLFAALDAPKVAARGARRWVWASGLALAPVAAVIVWFARPTPAPVAPADQVTMRGGAEPAAPPPATLVMYATRRLGPASHGPIRMVGELPGSGEARLSLGDYLQLGVRGLKEPMHVRVVGLEQDGRTHEYAGDTLLMPSAATVTLGGSVELARAHAPGRLRVVAIFSEKKVDDEAVRAAIGRFDPRRVERGGPSGDAAVVTGLLVIER
jgi:hypothetical protein